MTTWRWMFVPALLLAFSACSDETLADASAATSATEAGATHGGPPPQAAIDACDGAEAGAPCDFTIDGHELRGTCRAPSDEVPLACAPDRPPPPEVVLACEGADAGAPCDFTFDGHDVTGTCQTPGEDLPLACAPARDGHQPPPPPPPPPPMP